MGIQYLFVSWPEYHKITQELAATILAREKKYDEIVAVSRGGLTFGHLLSDALRLPICTFTIQSYIDVKTQGELVITEPLSKPIKDKNILLVDDVSDSGKTLKRAVSYLKNFGPKSITLVTLFYKPGSCVRPDYFAKDTDKWIVFPYEPTEMIISISRNMEKDGFTKAQIQDFLVNTGFELNQIAFTRKYYLMT
jgi:uncharacterized protein